MDRLAYVGAPADTVAKLAADAQACGDLPTCQEAAATETRDVSASSARGLQAECAPASDGLNCFETVVMPSH
uniref:Uncharacterized protein n=1 Tax=Saccharum spontaneum TaxID=62335 RepID=A0A678TQE0_SACSP|nr:hypothetical protein SS53D02_000004 [Saccharum spontaneum]